MGNTVRSQNKLLLDTYLETHNFGQSEIPKAPFPHFFSKINFIKTLWDVPSVREYCEIKTENVLVCRLCSHERNFDNSAPIDVNVIFYVRGK